MMDGASLRAAIKRATGDSLGTTDLQWNRGIFVWLLPLVGLVSLLLVSVKADRNIQQQRGLVIDGPQTPASEELWAHLSQHTPAENIFVFRKPFVLSLYGQRHSHVIIPLEVGDDVSPVTEAYRKTGVTSFVFDSEASTGKIEDWLNRFLDTSGAIHEVWRNSRYIIYEWRDEVTK